jgi:methylmalonyl-CoA mutase
VFAGKCSREFPFTAGLYPFKREGEDPSRMFAEKVDRKEPTNALCECRIASKTFVNAFDSVTLYGNDPHVRPDIYGKIAEFLCCLDDAKKLYSGLIWSCHDFSEYDY